MYGFFFLILMHYFLSSTLTVLKYFYHCCPRKCVLLNLFCGCYVPSNCKLYIPLREQNFRKSVLPTDDKQCVCGEIYTKYIFKQCQKPTKDANFRHRSMRAALAHNLEKL